MSLAIGIDLGTSNSVVSVYRRGVAEIVPVDGNSIMPSVVSFRDDGSALVGRPAKARMLSEPESTVASVKRFMGDRDKVYRIHGESYSPVMISALILKRLVEGASRKLGEKIRDAVITVPAYFTEAQREDTLRAGEAAGLNVLQLLPEPTAAAIAYELDRGTRQTIMVYDLGGGTFDVSVLTVEYNQFKVKAVGGNSRLGGDDFDQALVTWAAERFRAESGIDLVQDSTPEGIKARHRLKEAAEAAKIELSESDSAVIALPDCLGRPLEVEVSLEEYNSLILPLVKQTIQCAKSILQDVGLSARYIDKVILVGGSTRNRLVRELVTRETKEPYVAEEVDEVVAKGAAIVAASLRPATPERDLHPIEVTNVTGHSLGVDSLDSEDVVKFWTVIGRHTAYPCRRGLLVYTASPMQDYADMRVYRGESSEPDQNTYLGELRLPIAPPQPELVPIGAIFELDDNGIIRFTAVQLSDGPGAERIVKYSEEHGGELDLETADELITSGEARAETVSIKS